MKADNTPQISVLVVDDHPLFRDGLKNLLRKIAFVNQVAEAQHGREAIEMMRKEKYDVLLLDIEMPVMDGIETTDKLRYLYPDTRIMVLTMHTRPSYIMQMYDRGVNGYILKTTDAKELTRALSNIIDGVDYYTDEVKNVLFSNLLERDKASLKPDRSKLTEREKEVLVLLCEQYTCGEIADKLSISEFTVNGHRQKIMEKTSSKNVAGLVVYAIQNKLYFI